MGRENHELLSQSGWAELQLGAAKGNTVPWSCLGSTWSPIVGLWTHCLAPLFLFFLYLSRYNENLDLNKVMFEKYLTLLVSVLVPRNPAMPVPLGWLSYQQNGTGEVLSCIVQDICPCLNKCLCLKGFIEWTPETPVLVNSGVFISPRMYAQWGRWFVLEIFWVLPIYHRFYTHHLI